MAAHIQIDLSDANIFGTSEYISCCFIELYIHCNFLEAPNKTKFVYLFMCY